MSSQLQKGQSLYPCKEFKTKKAATCGVAGPVAKNGGSPIISPVPYASLAAASDSVSREERLPN